MEYCTCKPFRTQEFTTDVDLESERASSRSPDSNYEGQRGAMHEGRPEYLIELNWVGLMDSTLSLIYIYTSIHHVIHIHLNLMLQASDDLVIKLTKSIAMG